MKQPELVKQPELAIGMAAVAHRYPSILQMAFSFSKSPDETFKSKKEKVLTEVNNNNNNNNNNKEILRNSFGDPKSKNEKVLTEVKGNTRTLSVNKEQKKEISRLKLMIEIKNKEVEKLMDLCLDQREEIKSLKMSILFPDVKNSQLQELVEKQGSELKEAKQVIPSLLQQVSSLTGQLQSLAKDLAEVKADNDKYSAKTVFQGDGSLRTPPPHVREYASNSRNA